MRLREFSAEFLAHRHPIRRRLVVQQCRRINVWDFVNARLFPGTYVNLPRVRIVTRKAGCLTRRYIECPRCRRPVEYLFLPSGAKGWACRVCHDLAYASERYGRKNLLRRILPPRRDWSRILRYRPVFPDPEWWPEMPRLGKNPFRNNKLLVNWLLKQRADYERLPAWMRSTAA